MKSITLDEAIEKIGFGRFQSRLMLICGLVWASVGVDVLLVSFMLPSISQEWKLSSAQQGLLGTAIFLGMLVGAWAWGRLSDLVGRKIVFTGTVILCSVFSLLSAFAPTFSWLVVLRVLTGFGVGGTLPVAYSIFAEYLPSLKRGRYLVLLESFWALGTVTAAGLAWLVVPSLGWRWLTGISAIAGIMAVFIDRFVPESPRYLMVRGKIEQAINILFQVGEINGTSLKGYEIQPIKASSPASIGDLWKPSLRRTTILLWAVWFFISLGYYGIFTWLPNYFKASGMALLPVYQNSFILGLAQLPGYFSAAYLVERWGRRKTLGLYLLAGGVFTYLFAAATSLQWVLGMGVWMSFFSLGAWGAIYAYTPEVYPTNLRGTGMGAASSMTRLAGAIAPSLGALLANQSLSVPLTVFAVAYLVAGAAAFALPVETTKKPLLDVLKG